ncbi:unnamed protein product [Medioppia subpectinata]|uniref:Uncharacterized protein n=1 Tax=Medioppia subpectinata TaxID=1979941 RepID=A0A7R9KI49_9ACAR|nr:unnamed protein product [Medioppia subpectinata]CAG2104115.1 unnamed protein product [Medioppia subpectinata]
MDATDGDEDEEMLRKAALKSMALKDKSKDTSDLKKRNKNVVKSNNNYYKNSHRNNGSKHSNLIVLTKTEPQMPDITESESKNYTKISDKKTSCDVWKGSEQKGSVGPERFSRYERNDSTDESDEDSDDDRHSFTATANACEDIITPANVDMNSSEQLLCEDINDSDKCVDNNNDLNCITNRLTNCNNESKDDLSTTSTAEDVIDKKEPKERIKLNSFNDISKTSVFERRKQKFGPTSDGSAHNSDDKTSLSTDSYESNNTMNANTNTRISVKSRLSDNLRPKERSYSSKCRSSNSNHSINSNHNNNKEIDRRFKHNSKKAFERQMDLNGDDFRDCDNSSSKKRLRSFVVMK